MKKTLVVLLLFTLGLFAQTKTTQEAQIVVAVNTEKNEIVALYPLVEIKKGQDKLQRCAACTNFLGVLSGAYEQKGMTLYPKEGAIIKVFKDQEVYTEQTKFPNTGFKPKNDVVLGKTKATVVENKKGELILKTKKNEN